MFIKELCLTKDFNKLSHSYLFWGANAGAEERLQFALSLANFLEHEKWEVPEGVLFDTMILKANGIDAVREIKNFLWQKPVRSPKKVLIIEGAADLTDQAQNALLKITEEPPAHSLILLLVNNPDLLLPPLISRLQKVYFPFVATVSVKNFSADAQSLLNQLPRQKKEVIEKLANDPVLLKKFIKTIILELDKDPINNVNSLREILGRWAIMNQYNVNKKLQIEVLLQWIKL